ncbi:MAG: hypothetical protein LAQ69_36855 [Acidobacteriia bacterium]|nr:hypothetical protein [Terriglobia bacterium]
MAHLHLSRSFDVPIPLGPRQGRTKLYFRPVRLPHSNMENCAEDLDPQKLIPAGRLLGYLVCLIEVLVGLAKLPIHEGRITPVCQEARLYLIASVEVVWRPIL